MNDQIKVELSIPYILEDVEVKIAQSILLDPVQARVVSMLVYKNEIPEICSDLTINLAEALKRVFNIKKTSHIFIDDSMKKLFSSENDQAKVLSLKYGDYVDWKEVQIGDIKIHEKVVRSVNEKKFIGIGSNARTVHDNFLVPIISNENEKILHNEEWEPWVYPLNQKQNKIIENKSTPLFISGLVDKLVVLDPMHEMIADVNFKNYIVIVKKTYYNFIVEDNKIKWDDLATDKLMEAVKENFLENSQLLLEMTKCLNIGNFLDKLDDNAKIENLEYQKWLINNIDENLNEIGIDGYYVFEKSFVFELVRVNKTIFLENDQISFYCVGKNPINLADLIAKNHKQINYEAVLKIKDKMLSQAIYRHVIESKNQYVDAIALVNKWILDYGINKNDLMYILSILPSSRLIEFLSIYKNQFDDSKTIRLIKDNSQLSFENLYSLFKWNVEEITMFEEWEKEEQAKKANVYVNNIQSNDIGSDLSNLKQILNNIKIYNFDPIKLPNVEKQIKKIEDMIDRLEKEGSKETVILLARSIRVKIEDMIRNDTINEIQATLREKLLILYADDEALKRVINIYKFSSNYLHSKNSKENKKLFSEKNIAKLYEYKKYIDNVIITKKVEKEEL